MIHKSNERRREGFATITRAKLEKRPMSIRKDGKRCVQNKRHVRFVRTRLLSQDIPRNLVGMHYFRERNLVFTKVLPV